MPTNLIKNRDVFFFHQNKNILTRFYTNFFLEGQPYAVGKIFKCGAWSPGSNFPSCLRIKKLQEVDYLEACNMTLRRDLIFEVDGFDLNYTQTSEWCELDLAIRVKKLGYQLVFNPRVMVKHYLSRQGTFTKRNASLHRLTNFLRFYFRHVFKFSLSYILRFSSYLFFLFSYWLYKTHMKTTYGWQK